MDLIYLDHNATTPILPEVAEAMSQCHTVGYANPASQHRAGRRARQVLEEAREGIGRLLGADLDSPQPDHVLFTSGGTEANNLATFGLSRRTGRPIENAAPAPLPHLIISSIEHPSVVGPADWLKQQHYALDRLDVSHDGVIQVDKFAALLRPETRLVSVMLGNNETGVLQPVEQLAPICVAAGVPLHTDAVQVAGKLPVNFRQLGVTALSASAHKFHGPVGIGVLLLRHGTSLVPLSHGGFQQSGLRPGTESVALAVGMHTALLLWHREWSSRQARMTSLRDAFESALRSECPELVVHGANAPRLPHTTNVAFPGLDRQALMMALDLAGVACSTGSACASGSSEPSPTLVAMGCSKSLVQGSLRFSLGATTTQAEVAEAARRILRVYIDLRDAEPARKMPSFPPLKGRGPKANSL
jgi:cysteine desulfurase